MVEEVGEEARVVGEAVQAALAAVAVGEKAQNHIHIVLALLAVNQSKLFKIYIDRIIMIEYQLLRKIMKYSKCVSYPTPPSLSCDSNNQPFFLILGSQLIMIHFQRIVEN